MSEIYESDQHYETILVEDLDIVRLGRQGENDTQEVSIDCSAWLTELPGAELIVAARRYGEKAIYLPIVTADAGVVTWRSLAQDTAKAGWGQAEIRAQVDGKIKKSKVFRTYVEKALDGPGAPVETLPDWVAQIRGSVSTAQQAATTAEGQAQAAQAQATAAAGSAAEAAASAAAAQGSAASSAAAAAAVADLTDILAQTGYLVTEGVYVNRNSGALTENATGSPSAVTNVPVLGGASLTLTLSQCKYGSPRGVAFYDANGDFIVDSGVGYTANTLAYQMTAPANAATMGFTTFAGAEWKLTGNLEVADMVRKMNSFGRYQNGVSLGSLEKQEGFFVNGLTGATAAGETYDVYTMRVFEGTTVSLAIPDFTHATVGYALYDEKGAYITGGAYSSAKGTVYAVSVPVGAVTLRFSASKAANVRPPRVDCLTGADEVYRTVRGLMAEKDDSDPLGRIGEQPTFIRAFRKIACIGDSLTAGALDETSPDPTSAYIDADFSYPSQLAKLTGVSVFNLGAGGSKAAHPNTGTLDDRSWWEFMEAGTRFPTANFKQNPCDVYIIALGTNDISDTTEFTGEVTAAGVQDAATSVGGYAEIIRRIKVYQPKAKIFLVTIPTWRNGNATQAPKRDAANEKIRALASYFSNCYCIDLAAYDTADFRTYYVNGGHNNALGYNLRARQYAAYIDWIIRHNPADFRNIGFIGTDKDYQPGT